MEKETKELPGLINGEEAMVGYEVTPFSAMKGIKIAVKLAKTFGGGLSKVAGSAGAEAALNLDVGQVIDGILSNLDEDETPKLIALILSGTKRNTITLDMNAIDKIYAKNYKELMLALRFSLEVNFGGFIGALTQGQVFTGDVTQALNANPAS